MLMNGLSCSHEQGPRLKEPGDWTTASTRAFQNSWRSSCIGEQERGFYDTLRITKESSLLVGSFFLVHAPPICKPVVAAPVSRALQRQEGSCYSKMLRKKGVQQERKGSRRGGRAGGGGSKTDFICTVSFRNKTSKQLRDVQKKTSWPHTSLRFKTFLINFGMYSHRRAENIKVWLLVALQNHSTSSAITSTVRISMNVQLLMFRRCVTSPNAFNYCGCEWLLLNVEVLRWWW